TAVLGRARVEDLDDVLALHEAGGLGFALEAGHGLAVGGERGVDELHGHALADAGVDGLVDRSHAAAAQQTTDLVLADARALERVALFRCGRWRRGHVSLGATDPPRPWSG